LYFSADILISTSYQERRKIIERGCPAFAGDSNKRMEKLIKMAQKSGLFPTRTSSGRQGEAHVAEVQLVLGREDYDIQWLQMKKLSRRKR